MLNLSLIDGALVIGYLAFLLVVAWKTRHESRGDEDSFLLAGRRLTLPAFVATLVSTWYGGILGVGEYSFRYGISNWLVFGLPYYVAAALFALFLAHRARRSLLVSIPDQLEQAYGRGPALLGAGVVFVMTVPAAYVLMIGVLLKAFFGGSLLVWIALGTLFSTIYVTFGGFRSVVRTDILQFILMYAGFAMILLLAVIHYGGFDYLRNHLPAEHLTWNGGLPTGAIAVWYVIALATLVEPSFYQRCYAARTEGVARGGILISILFWGIFDSLTTFTGLYARAALGDGADPLLSYPLLADRLLPPFAKGLFLLALLAVIMSTVDSYSFIAAQTLGRDLVARARGRMHTWDARNVQYGLAASALLAIGIAAWKGSAVAIWHDLGSIGTPMLLLPIAGSFRKPPVFHKRWIVLAMAVSGIGSLIWTMLGTYGSGYPFGVEPIFIGLGLSILLLLPAWLKARGLPAR